jgi:hypothetical protein
VTQNSVNQPPVSEDPAGGGDFAPEGIECVVGNVRMEISGH